jgi:hypothetical protein
MQVTAREALRMVTSLSVLVLAAAMAETLANLAMIVCMRALIRR